MERTNKTSRGKHRWILVKFPGEHIRNSLKEEISACFNNIHWKLYDIYHQNNISYAIIKVQLHQYKEAIDAINNNENSSTLTSSGKIRLVRLRIEEIISKQSNSSYDQHL